MNRVSRMVPYRTISVILIVAFVLATVGVVVQTLRNAGPLTGYESKSVEEGETGITVEVETNSVQLAPAASRNWSADEIGTGSPNIAIEDDNSLSGEDDFMNLGRYLEQAATSSESESSYQASAAPEDHKWQELDSLDVQPAYQTFAAPEDRKWQENGCEGAPLAGHQPC